MMLRANLQRLQRAIELNPDDPAPQRLKSSILHTIAALDRKKSSRRRTVVVQILPTAER
jgi:hypothetical protein